VESDPHPFVPPALFGMSNRVRNLVEREFIAGASGLAAPVFDRHSRARAACTVIGPTPRLLARRDALPRLVKAAGERISRTLGYQPA
jgi:DNA-binding IclR family transcriptional regulator